MSISYEQPETINLQHAKSMQLSLARRGRKGGGGQRQKEALLVDDYTKDGG